MRVEITLSDEEVSVFWSRVNKTESCWIWTHGADHRDYGQVWMRGQRKFVRAHRVSYMLTHGPIPAGLEIDHLCRVHRCVNPAHLEAVTHKENCLRGIAPSATNARKTHCIRGHAFDAGNTVLKDGYRQCRTCGLANGRERMARYRLRQRHPFTPTTARVSYTRALTEEERTR